MKRKKIKLTKTARQRIDREVNMRLIRLEAAHQQASEYRKALAVVRRRERDLQDARKELEKAAAAFLDPYLPTEWRSEILINPTSGTGSGVSTTNQPVVWRHA